MSLVDGLLHRVRVLWRGEAYAREQAHEVEFHLELEAMARASADNAHDMDAARAARRAFGNMTYYREESRRMTLLHWVDRLQQDARYAMRGLRRAPGFTAMVVITLALGFGVNAAMFSLLNRLFLHQPDGVVRPEYVRRFYNEFHASGGLNGGGRTNVFDRYEYPHFRAMRRSGVGDALGLTTSADSIRLEGGRGAIATKESMVSSAYFSILGLKPALGRFFVAEEDSVETPTPVAVISEYLWRTQFDRHADVVGTVVTIDRRPFTIIGVAPRTFRGIDLDAVDVWVPLNTYSYQTTSRTPWYDGFSLSARMIARVASPADEARLVTIVQNAMQTTQIPHYAFDPTEKAMAGPLIAGRGPSKPEQEMSVLTRVSAVAVFVLIIAVANVVNLLLLRAANRRREISLRRALGVSTGRLIWQLVVEGTLLSLIAGVVAIAIGAWSGAMLRRLAMPTTHWATPPIDLSTATFIFCLSLLIGIITGLAPVFHGARVPVGDALKAGRGGDAHHQSATRSGLLVLQAALCVVLLVGAGLFSKSLANATSIDTGYDVADVVMVSPRFPPRTGNHVVAAARIVPAIARGLTRNPAVAVASFAQVQPMRGARFTSVFLQSGNTLPRLPNDIGPSMNVVSSTFFDAMGMHVLRGRGFTTGDGPSGPRVVVVSAKLANTAWPNAEPLGKCLVIGDRASPCTTVVGVVNDANRLDLIEDRGMVYYLPATQPPDTLFPILNLIIRARPGQAARAELVAAQAVALGFPGLDGVDSRTLYSVIERDARPWSVGAMIFSALSILAFIVAGVGVYSVVAYGVTQRTHELGIRIALGANRSQITDLVIGSGLRSVGVGVVIGLIASWMLAPLVRSLLFGVTADDASTYIGAATALGVLGTVASLVPALRAARVDPVVALRSE